jgi:hypothetical protein
MHNTYIKYGFSAVFLILSASCGGSSTNAAPASAPDDGVANANSHVAPMPQVSQELGSIDPNAVERTFDHLQNKIQGCFKAGASRIEYLDGDVSVFVRVGQDGHAKYTYFEDSSVGDRDTEKCLLDVMTNADWPKPQGGEAEVRKSFGYDASGDVRAPTAWNSDKIAASVGKASDAIAKCKDGVSGSFKGAAYIEPDGKKGKVQAAGLASPSKDGVDKIDCLLGVVTSLQVPSPGSYAAKVTFAL